MAISDQPKLQPKKKKKKTYRLNRLQPNLFHSIRSEPQLHELDPNRNQVSPSSISMIVTNTPMADLALTNLAYCSHADLHGFVVPSTKVHLASITDSFILSLTRWRSVWFVMIPFMGFVLNWELEFDLRCKERERRLRLREELGIWFEEERTPIGRERQIVRREKKSIKKVRGERKVE